MIYEHEALGGALNLNSTNYPDHGHHGDPPLWEKNPHGRAGNQTRDLIISSQKRWPLDHEAGHISTLYLPELKYSVLMFQTYEQDLLQFSISFLCTGLNSNSLLY
jgi:hypothetical protein